MSLEAAAVGPSSAQRLALRFGFDLNGDDVLRDTPLRLLGYTNEVGESFRAVVPLRYVRASYVIASSYVVADTFDKSAKEYRLHVSEPSLRTHAVSLAALDTLLWQSLASVLVPGLTVNRLCALSALLLGRTRLLKPLQRTLTTSLGLASIPFIVKPIDAAVDAFMDRCVRSFFAFDSAADAELITEHHR